MAAKISLDIGIVGAGIGGLAAAIACAQIGMKVTVYEAARELEEVGAGLIIGPNISKILNQWGILDTLHCEMVNIKQISLRRFDNGIEISRQCLDNFEKTTGASMFAIHRGDLQKALKNAAEAAGAQIQLGTRVTDIDFQRTCIKIGRDDQWLQKDVIIAADGIKSTIRGQMLAIHGNKSELRAIGHAVWRILVPAEKIYNSNDADLIHLLESSIHTRWLGPNGHIVCYPIKRHKSLNLVLSHPPKSNMKELSPRKTDKKDILDFYENWNPCVKKLFAFIPDGEVLEWMLYDHESLPRWVENNVALIGDASHPLVPYVAQGAAQAIEDAVVLAACLGMIESCEEIPIALKVYEHMRKERTELIQQTGMQLSKILHLHDGEEQQHRDEMMRQRADSALHPDPWSNKSFHNWCWSADAEKQAKDMWNHVIKLVTDDKQFDLSFKVKNVSSSPGFNKSEGTKEEHGSNGNEQQRSAENSIQG